ncbi:MAG TPA: hypothetical protein VNT42_04825 [Sphingomonas sp.]|nr:hypothetical protein [Sphingomonas sp.]
MIQAVATLGSILIAVSMLGVIVAVLADDWSAVAGALRLRRPLLLSPLPDRARSARDRRARVVALSSQSAPRTAAA